MTLKKNKYYTPPPTCSTRPSNLVPVYLITLIGSLLLGGSIHTLKENAEALVAVTREIGLEVSADKTKYMVMSRDQNAG